jgi:hypothetical protein
MKKKILEFLEMVETLLGKGEVGLKKLHAILLVLAPYLSGGAEALLEKLEKLDEQADTYVGDAITIIDEIRKILSGTDEQGGEEAIPEEILLILEGILP